MVFTPLWMVSFAALWALIGLTAVAVVPPEEVWGPIQAIRGKHDRQFRHDFGVRPGAAHPSGQQQDSPFGAVGAALNGLPFGLHAATIYSCCPSEATQPQRYGRLPLQRRRGGS